MTKRKFMDKRLLVDAIQFTGENKEECLKFCDAAQGILHAQDKLAVPVGGSDRKCLCSVGDWIVRDARGRFSLVAEIAFAVNFKEYSGLNTMAIPRPPTASLLTRIGRKVRSLLSRRRFRKMTKKALFVRDGVPMLNPGKLREEEVRAVLANADDPHSVFPLRPYRVDPDTSQELIVAPPGMGHLLSERTDCF